MKIINIFNCISAGMLAIALSGCNDEVYSPIENGLYLAEAAPGNSYNQQVEVVTVNDVVTKTLTASLAVPAKEDVKVIFELDPSLIEAYNGKHGTSYQLLPEEYLDFEAGKEVVVSAGLTSAEAEKLVIKPYTTPNAEVYAVPVRMKHVSGAVNLTGSADHILYLLASPNRQQSIVLHRGNETELDIPVKEMSAFTIEFWVKVNNKTGWVPSDSEPWFGNGKDNDPSKWRRQRIFGDNCGPITAGEVLLRWWADGANGRGPTLQCQLNGSYFDSEEFWEADTWYHIAYVFDGSNIILYRNGKEDKKLGRTDPFTFERISLFNLSGSGSQAYNMEMEMSQIRIWSKALSDTNIKDGMSRQLPGDSEGLYAYWPCNEGEGNVLKGSGELARDVTVRGNLQWSGTVYDFSNPNRK